MEKRINKKVESYISEFKEKIRNKTNELGIANDSINQLIQYIYDYEHIDLKKDDFAKRKRVKNVVPFFDRCSAKRASNEQCTRRKKEGCEYCGTHMKGTPHGVLEQQNTESGQNVQKVEVWAQDIQGIVYYIDKNGNVYQTEDILGNKPNPKIIAKYVQQGEIYSIPEFGI
jgi:hypothetical protein